MIKISIALDQKEQLDLLVVAIEHLMYDDIGMSKALAADGKIADAKKLRKRGEDLAALRNVVTGYNINK